MLLPAASTSSKKSMNLSKLETRIGCEFVDQQLFVQALTHRSFGKNNNERLEFLGDSLLNLIIAEALFLKFNEAREGDLSRLRSSLVKGVTLAQVGKEFDLGDYLLLGEGELKSGGFRRESILADAVEAIIGAIFLDAGMAKCREIVLLWFSKRLSDISLSNTSKDPKTRLQEYLQERKQEIPSYSVIETSGLSHAMEFLVECRLSGNGIVCQAKGASKRTAEKLAAEKMLALLKQAL
ncbi:MAG: ribonuclease-3 [Lentisphaeria bacterium]|jgi:ribonuclease-3